MQQSHDQSINKLKSKINLKNEVIHDLYRDKYFIKSQYERLLKDTSDLLTNWDQYQYHKLYYKLNGMKTEYNIEFEEKYMLIGNFSKRSEILVQEIKSIIPTAKYYQRQPSIHDLINDLDHMGYFNGLCSINGANCKGRCADIGCGVNLKDYFNLWKKQRNLMVHRQCESQWIQPMILDLLMRNVESVVTKWLQTKQRNIIC